MRTAAAKFRVVAKPNRRSTLTMQNNSNMQTVTGTVISAKRIWCIHINKRPLLPTEKGGALFPYAVTFKFEAGGKTYILKKFSGFLAASPLPGDLVTVTYRAAKPEKCKIVTIENNESHHL